MKNLRQIFLRCLDRAFKAEDGALEELAQQDPERVREFLARPKTKAIFDGSLFQEAIRRQPMMLVRLVELGWPVDAVMTKNQGFLGVAIELGSAEAVEGLLALGADPNAIVNGVCPLYHCGNISGANTDEEAALLSSQAARIAQLLCEQGADPNGGDSMVQPMAGLAARGAIEPALVLIAHGAGLQVGDTSADAIARQCGHDDFAQQVVAAFERHRLETGTAQVNRKSQAGRRL